MTGNSSIKNNLKSELPVVLLIITLALVSITVVSSFGFSSLELEEDEEFEIPSEHITNADTDITSYYVECGDNDSEYDAEINPDYYTGKINESDVRRYCTQEAGILTMKDGYLINDDGKVFKSNYSIVEKSISNISRVPYDYPLPDEKVVGNPFEDDHRNILLDCNNNSEIDYDFDEPWVITDEIEYLCGDLNEYTVYAPEAYDQP